jgi:hypothetical protein
MDLKRSARGQKWSFPLTRTARRQGLPGGWTSVFKTRQVSHFGLAGGRAVTGDRPPAGHPACEAPGPDATRRIILQATALLLFDQPVPDHAGLGPENSSSYPHWLTQADADTGKAR